MEQWRRRQFRCCGRNVDLPVEWGIPEQRCGLNMNKFVYLEELDHFNIHSGLCSARMTSDTTFFGAGGLQPGMLVYGGYQDNTDSAITIGQPVAQRDYGFACDSNALGLRFYLKTSNGIPDTFSYSYLFTRWDSVQHTADTLAYKYVELPDSRIPMDDWFSVTDTIQYRHAGTPDSVRIIFCNGRAGNLALLGNTTWIDDVSLLYDLSEPATGITPETVVVPFTISPIPATNTLRIRSGKDVKGDQLELYDEVGRLVSQTVLETAIQSIDVSRLAQGIYNCNILDNGHHSLYQTKISVVR